MEGKGVQSTKDPQNQDIETVFLAETIYVFL